jgi:hypothetical protein
VAVLGRLLVSSAERLDLPDLLSLDSYAAGDWQYFLKGLVGDTKPFILKGFDVIDPGNAIGTQSCSIRVADSITFYPGSNSGSFFHGLQEGHPQAAPLVPELRKNAVNYVYLTFSTFNTSVDTRAFWDPDKDGGVGGEFTQDINTESVLQVQVNVSTGSFPANTIPVAKITVGPVVITAIEDARDLMFRLGSGGINPNPFNTYAWRSQPGSQYARQEPPTQMLAGGVNPFQGADKNILTLKEWMDAIMSKLRELGGTTYWYDDTSSFSIITNFYDAVATAFKSKGKWVHDLTTPGLLTWTEDIQIKMASDPRTYIVRQGSKTLTNEQVMYMAMQRNLLLNVTDESVSWINGQLYVNTIGGAVGLFANLAKGDYIKKANDTIDKWVRVEEFYDAVNLGGSTTTAAGARSVRLSSAYLGVTGAEKGRYDKGVYLPADLVVSDRNQAAIANTGGNFNWLALRSDTIENVGNAVTTDLVVAIDQHDGSTARVTATAHGLVDGDRVTIAGTTNFDGTYQVEVETANIFYITISGGPFADESGTGHYATITTAARSTPYGFQEESANHGFSTDDTIIIAGTTNYNGSYKINVLSATSFNIAMPGPAATETVGTATLAKIIVRTVGSVEQLIQGQSADIGGSVAENIRQYVGMDSLSQTAPIYAVAPGYNTLDGMQNYNSIVGENLTARVSKLTSMMADKAQDKTILALPSSGITSINNVTNGAAQEVTFSPPGASLTFITPGSDGQYILPLPDTAPGISLLANQAAYVEIDRNNPTNVGTYTVADIEDVPVSENIFLVAVRLLGTEVYLWEGSIITIGSVPGPGFDATIVKQNQMLKLVEGGTWSWDLGTETLSWSADAFVQVPGLANSVNQIVAGSIVLNTGEVAVLDINRTGPGGAIVATAATNASLIATTNMFIMARREGNDVIVGLHSMRLMDGESKALYAGVSNQHLAFTGAFTQAEAFPTYNGPLRNITQGQSLTDGISSLDTELDKFFGQLQLRPTAPVSTRALITGIDLTMLNTSVLGQELVGLLMKFDGAQIDFATGQIFEADGTTPLGQNFTPATIAANQFRWYSVSLIPNALDAQNRMTAQVLVLPANADGALAAALAPRAVFGGIKNIGQVVVQDDGTGGSGTILNINQDDVVQLGVGSGSGSGASVKIIGGGTFSNAGGGATVFSSNTVHNSFGNLIASASGVASTGQSFQVGASGNINNIRVPLTRFGSPTGTFTMSLYNATLSLGNYLPTGSPIATSTTTVDASTVLTSFVDYDFAFSSVPVVSGNYYAWVIDNTNVTFSNASNSIRCRFNSPSVVTGNAVQGTLVYPSINNFSAIALDFVFEVEGTSGVSLAFTQPMYLEKAGLAYSDNTILAGVSPIIFPADQDVAYVVPNLSSGGPNLTVVVDILPDVPVNAIIIARREGNDIIVGSSSMRLISGESKKLYAGVSDQLLNVIPAASNADYTGQLRLLENVATPVRVNVSAVSKIVPDGTEYGIQLKNLLLEFSGAQIDFDSGDIFEEDGTTPLGINFTPATIAAGQYRWYSVTLVPNVVTADNKISGQLVVIPANADGASPALAPKSAFASSGIQLGQVVVQESGGSIAAISQNDIVQLTASGGGGGAGDANELIERLKDRLIEAPFEWVNANIFLTDEDNKIDTATATFDVANTLYKFTAIGQNIVSKQSLDPEFLTEEKDVNSVELMAFWDRTGIDSNATYEVSRNGGVDWSTVDMSRVGTTTETFRGIYKFPVDTTYNLLSQWPLANATAYREMNTTTLQSIGQIWAVDADEAWAAQRTILYINKVGAPVGSVLVQLVRNNAGSPSTSALDIIAQQEVLASSLASGDNAVTLNWGINVLPAGSYHFVIATDAAYKAGFSAGVNSVRARVDNSAPLGPNTLTEFNGTAWAPNVTQSLIYRIEGRELNLRVRITSSAADVLLKGYGIFYSRQEGIINGIKNREVQTFDGTIDNFNTFTLTNFLPEADLLKVYHVQTGQVYLYGTSGFSLNGQQVVFPANTFNGLDTVTLVFDQIEGTSFDNSDQNAALLAANFLGSTDATIDRSQNGRGIFLRRPDGTLREITIDNSDNIVVYSV